MSTRTEEDLLGTAEVPADVYYGIHAQRAVDNFQISASTINDVPEFIRGMVQVKKATAMANRRLHALPKDKAEAIIAACDKILDEGVCMDQFPIDVFQGGAGTSLNMNTNEVVANLALELIGRDKGDYSVINPNDDVNMSQSTNDAYPTGFRLGVYYAVQGLLEELDELQKALRAKGDEFADIIKMGRTQLQDAVPMTLGQEFTAFGANLAEEQRTISSAADSLLEINLGATAIGTGINTPNGYRDQVVSALREVTGLDIQASPDLIEATSDTGGYVMMHGAIKRAAMKLSKPASRNASPAPCRRRACSTTPPPSSPSTWPWRRRWRTVKWTSAKGSSNSSTRRSPLWSSAWWWAGSPPCSPTPCLTPLSAPHSRGCCRLPSMPALRRSRPRA